MQEHSGLYAGQWYLQQMQSYGQKSGGTFDGATQAALSAIEGNSRTRWSTGHAQTAGQWFTLDLGATQSFSTITLNAGSSTNDYPRGYEVFVSNDGRSWGNPVATGIGKAALVLINFATQSARYVRVVQTGSSPSWWWSIADLNVLP